MPAGTGLPKAATSKGTRGVKIANSIVSGGSGPAGAANCGEKLESQGFNIESANECGFGAGGDKVNTDPQLGPLQSNGGPAPTMAPAFTSPAVDQGTAAGLGSDERGVIRPIDFPTIPNSAGGDGSDIGAVELQPSNALRAREAEEEQEERHRDPHRHRCPNRRPAASRSMAKASKLRRLRSPVRPR